MDLPQPPSHSRRMPVLFVGHGSPMSCVAENAFTRRLDRLGRSLPLPKAILVVSAHWLTHGSFVTADPAPGLIYDFFGFPPELYELQYPMPGSPEIAERVREVTGGVVQPAPGRGIDHAAWMILRHAYPAADIPVLEVSLDLSLSAKRHYALGRRLAALRDEGVLIIGSGNIVHNLGQVDRDQDALTVTWAEEFDGWVATAIAERRHADLIDYLDRGPSARLAAPTSDHYLPLLYAAALQGPDEPSGTIHMSFQHGSISMRCIQFG